jgi:hypothetical protein
MESDDELEPETLPHGMHCDHCFEFTDDRCVSTESEASLEKLLLRKDTKFVETHRLEPRPVLFGELLERRPPPTRESAFQQFDCRLRVRRGARSLAQLLKTTGVDHLVWKLEYVSRWTSNDLGLGAKGPTESREMALENPKRVHGRVVAPQLVAQSVRRDD